MDPALAHESRAAIPVAVVIATLSVAVITVALRTYTRLVVIKQFGYDDVGAVISLVSAPITVVSNTVQCFPPKHPLTIETAHGCRLRCFHSLRITIRGRSPSDCRRSIIDTSLLQGQLLLRDTAALAELSG